MPRGGRDGRKGGGARRSCLQADLSAWLTQIRDHLRMRGHCTRGQQLTVSKRARTRAGAAPQSRETLAGSMGVTHLVCSATRLEHLHQTQHPLPAALQPASGWCHSTPAEPTGWAVAAAPSLQQSAVTPLPGAARLLLVQHRRYPSPTPPPLLLRVLELWHCLLWRLACPGETLGPATLTGSSCQPCSGCHSPAQHGGWPGGTLHVSPPAAPALWQQAGSKQQHAHASARHFKGRIRPFKPCTHVHTRRLTLTSGRATQPREADLMTKQCGGRKMRLAHLHGHQPAAAGPGQHVVPAHCGSPRRH